MLEKLITILAKNYLSGEDKKSFCAGWDAAVRYINFVFINEN